MSATTAPMRRILLPIRVRLAVGYSLLIALLLAMLAVVVYSTVTENWKTELDQSLATRAQQVLLSSAVRFDGRGLQIVLPTAQFSESDIYVQVVDAEGSVQAKSDNLGDAQLPIDGLPPSLSRDAVAQLQTGTIGSERVRLYNAPWFYRGVPIGYLQTGRLLSQLEAQVGALRLALILGCVAAFFLALALGWVVSGQALHPLGRLTRTAERIGQERDFSRRVQYAGPKDEVGRLADTFNAMLDQLQSAYGDAQEAARRLEAALVAQKRFVADASHELRTPLTAIRGNAELMERVPNMDPEDRQASVIQIANEAQRMSRLVNDMLALARADAGQQLRKEPVEIKALVHEATAAARHLPGGERLVVAEPLPDTTVLGDGDNLRQLLLILLDNALKYTPADGRVDLAARIVGEQVEIAVADTGPGIAPEHLPHIFERFYRADPARSAGGTGLGLAIAGWIVNEHDGQIRVQSAPGAGSTFTVILPVAYAQFRLPQPDMVHAQ